MSSQSTETNPYELLAQRMREGILESLQPFLVKEDSFSGVLMHTIKRLLAKADIVDLTNVLISADTFITEMRPFLDEYNDFQQEIIDAIRGDEAPAPSTVSDDATSDDRGYDTDSGGPTDRPGDIDWKDTVREIHASTVHNQNILQEVPSAGESVGSGHEAPLAGDDGSNGGSTIGAVS